MFIIFWAFWWLNKFYFHHKWNETSLLVLNWYITVALRDVARLNTWDLRKLGNTSKTSKLHRIRTLCPDSPEERQISTGMAHSRRYIWLKICWIIRIFAPEQPTHPRKITMRTILKVVEIRWSYSRNSNIQKYGRRRIQSSKIAWDHSFSTYANFSEKLMFLFPW